MLIRRVTGDNWEISIISFNDNKGTKYNVTRRLPELSVAETKLFKNRKLAEKQFLEWLNQTTNF